VALQQAWRAPVEKRQSPMHQGQKAPALKASRKEGTCFTPLVHVHCHGFREPLAAPWREEEAGATAFTYMRRHGLLLMRQCATGPFGLNET